MFQEDTTSARKPVIILTGRAWIVQVPIVPDTALRAREVGKVSRRADTDLYESP